MSGTDKLAEQLWRLGAIEDIKQLKHRYVRSMTLSLWDEMETLLTEDIKASYSDGKYVFDGRGPLLEFLRGAHGAARRDVLGYWHVTMPEIRLYDTDNASGTWGMYHFFVDKTDNRQLEMFAYYEDEYLRVDGAWRIRRTGYRRVMEQELDRKQITSLRLNVG